MTCSVPPSNVFQCRLQDYAAAWHRVRPEAHAFELGFECDGMLQRTKLLLSSASNIVVPLERNYDLAKTY
jgi:hypothetical protein